MTLLVKFIAIINGLLLRICRMNYKITSELIKNIPTCRHVFVIYWIIGRYSLI